MVVFGFAFVVVFVVVFGFVVAFACVFVVGCAFVVGFGFVVVFAFGFAFGFAKMATHKEIKAPLSFQRCQSCGRYFDALELKLARYNPNAL